MRAVSQLFHAVVHACNSDSEGEVKLVLKVPLLDAEKAKAIPVKTVLMVSVWTEQEFRDHANSIMEATT